MNIENCKIISTVEFGSTYQGTADAQSDVDLMSLVIQPLEDTIFRNHEKAAKHIDDVRYYPVERFIRLISKPSFDSVLLLTAQLEQARDCDFNKEVLSIFYDESIFKTYILGSIKPIGYSIIGNIDRLMKKEHPTGKDYIKMLTFYHHLNHLLELLSQYDFSETVKDIQTSYDTFSKVNIEDRLHLKRLSADEMDDKRIKVLKSACIEDIQHFKNELSASENRKDVSLSIAYEAIFTTLKHDTTKFLVKQFTERTCK